MEKEHLSKKRNLLSSRRFQKRAIGSSRKAQIPNSDYTLKSAGLEIFHCSKKLT
jgi:hypothetical protein